MKNKSETIEDVGRKVITDEEFKNLGYLIKTLDEITTLRMREVKEFMSILSLFVKNNQTNKRKKQVSDRDIQSLGKLLNNSYHINLFSECLSLCFDNKGKGSKKIANTRNELIEELSNIKNELFKTTKLIPLGKANNVMDVLLYSFYFKSNPSMINKVKILSNNYITLVLKLILNEKEFLKEEIYDFNHLKRDFVMILKNIHEGSKIVISEETDFYNNLKKRYFVENVDDGCQEKKTDEKLDVMQNIKQGIQDYNAEFDKLNDPFSSEVNSFLEYLLNTSVEKLEYDKFPSYENVNCLKIITEARQKLIEEKDMEDFPEKLAILDAYHATYYKYVDGDSIKHCDDSISKKQIKKQYN